MSDDERIEVSFDDDEPAKPADDRIDISLDDLTQEPPATTSEANSSGGFFFDEPDAASTTATSPAKTKKRGRRVGVIVAVLLALLAGGATFAVLTLPLTPRMAMQRFERAMQQQRWRVATGYLSAGTLTAAEGVRDTICTDIAKTGDAQLKADTGLTFHKLAAMESRDFLAAVYQYGAKIKSAPPRPEFGQILTEKRTGNHATIDVNGAGGKKTTVQLVREGLLWKLDLTSMLK